ncbi:chromosome segregation ATPase [Burkholderia pseudomallei]|nr:chromosome segregation ATPase [Burkholderia pseudomallei]
MPDEVDVESEVNELFVLLRPEKKKKKKKLVVLSPLEREVIELLADESPVDVATRAPSTWRSTAT